MLQILTKNELQSMPPASQALFYKVKEVFACHGRFWHVLAIYLVLDLACFQKM